MPPQLLPDLRAVKLTLAPDGTVWSLDGQGLPRSTGLPPADVLRALPGGEPRLVRVPGLPGNAPLLLGLYREAMKGSSAVSGLEVCGPSFAVPGGPPADPALLLYHARAFDVPASVGGWRRFTEADALAYGLAARLAGQPYDEEAAVADLGRHPVWPYLSFVAGLDARAAARLVGMVLDPRWYADPSRPEQHNRLPQFLGLDPRTQSAQKVDASGRVLRNRLVLACWKNGNPPPPGDVRPGQFLWRTWFARGGGARGDLAASKRFVEYLRQTWTAAAATGPQKSRLFAPKCFFPEPKDAAGFAAHLGGGAGERQNAGPG